MTLLTGAGSGSAILTPGQVQSLVIEPLLNQAVATQVSSIVQTSSTSTRFPSSSKIRSRPGSRRAQRSHRRTPIWTNWYARH